MSAVYQILFKSGPAFAINQILGSDQYHQTLIESVTGTMLYCCFLLEATSLSNKNKKWK